MSLAAVVGKTQMPDGREAGALAARMAVDQLGRNPIIQGFIFASHHLALQQVLSGASALLGDAPLLGFSTSSEITSSGQQNHSVVVALLNGNDAVSRSDWQGGFSEDSRSVTQKLIQALQLDNNEGTLLIVADGFNGDAKEMCAVLPDGNYTLAGCLAGGDIRQARTFQVGGRQSGHGGLAAAALSGKIAVGVGLASGWQPVGVYFQVTSARGPWIRALDGKNPTETYALMFGRQSRDWAFPPLNELVRLYPLGLERGKDQPLLIRSPLRVEADGSLRMHTLIAEESIAHLLVGSADNCIKAAEQASFQALDLIGKAKPVLALVLPDISWNMLMQTQPGAEIAAVRRILGPDVPIAGGYTFGQIARTQVDSKRSGSAEFYNQMIEVIVFGQVEE